MKNVLDLSLASYGDVVGKKYDMAILPWGATEPHNYHLPYSTDSILSHDISVEAATGALNSGVRCMVLPTVTLGSQNPGQRELSFCIHARYQTQYFILHDVVESLNHQNITRLLIVNGHGGNSFKNMIRDLAVDFPDFVVASCEWYRLANGTDLFDNAGEHADELESSVMMHYHPELVDLSSAGAGSITAPKLKPLRDGSIWLPRNWAEISKDTGLGDPSKATATKGKLFAGRITEKLTEIIVEFCN